MCSTCGRRVTQSTGTAPWGHQRWRRCSSQAAWARTSRTVVVGARFRLDREGDGGGGEGDVVDVAVTVPGQRMAHAPAFALEGAQRAVHLGSERAPTRARLARCAQCRACSPSATARRRSMAVTAGMPASAVSNAAMSAAPAAVVASAARVSRLSCWRRGCERAPMRDLTGERGRCMNRVRVRWARVRTQPRPRRSARLCVPRPRARSPRRLRARLRPGAEQLAHGGGGRPLGGLQASDGLGPAAARMGA